MQQYVITELLTMNKREYHITQKQRKPLYINVFMISPVHETIHFMHFI